MRRVMYKRLVEEQKGFTLAEVLVTMLMMLTVMFALYSIFDMTLRVFSFGNDKVEAVENARIGMERMEREIRAAYPYDKVDETSPNEELFPYFGSEPSNQITFGNDTNGDRQIDPSEEITYRVNGTALEREGQAAVENVNSLNFDYLQSNGTSASTESEVERISITLRINVDGRTQNLSTTVALRNRSE